jgi:Sec-independent protein translocase protein TatA
VVKKIPNLVRGSGLGMSEFKHPKKKLKRTNKSWNEIQKQGEKKFRII